MNKLAEHLVKEGLERKRYVCKNCQKSVKTQNDSAVNTDLGTDLVAALSGLDVHDFTHSDAVELALITVNHSTHKLPALSDMY